MKQERLGRGSWSLFVCLLLGVTLRYAHVLGVWLRDMLYEHPYLPAADKDGLKKVPEDIKTVHSII